MLTASRRDLNRSAGCSSYSLPDEIQIPLCGSNQTMFPLRVRGRPLTDGTAQSWIASQPSHSLIQRLVIVWPDLNADIVRQFGVPAVV